MRPYRDRIEAGDRLAADVAALLERDPSTYPDPIVLGLPRGGVPVAERVAAALQAPLDVVVVRKLGVPRQREVAMGALATVGDRVIRIVQSDTMRWVRAQGIAEEELDQVEAVELAELRRRQARYRGEAASLDLTGRSAIVVDDGLATGATMLAAIGAVRNAGAAHIVVAVPVALSGARERFDREVDAVVCSWELDAPAIGHAYAPFTQVSDEAVCEILARA